MSFTEFLSYRLLGHITIQDIFEVLAILAIARFLVISSIKMVRHYCKQYNLPPDSSKVIRQAVRIVINFLSLIITVWALGLSISNFLSTELFHAGDIKFLVSNLVNAFFIMIAARSFLWTINQTLLKYYDTHPKFDVGTQFAVRQILKYVIYTLAILSSIQALGFNLTVIWGGAAALLVGFGLGLQQTFTDLISGIFMLVEQGVNVGHIIQVDDKVGRVKKIGFRASEIITRDNIVLLIPNSKLVTDTVTNWSHNDTDVRFTVEVGVAYGSNTELVKELLYQVAINHNEVLKTPNPNVRFVTFGDSSLNFQLLFWISAHNFLTIEDIKSDLNYAIDKAFRAHNISIPFPQRDIWVKEIKN